MRFLATVALALLLSAAAASAQSPATFPLTIKVADATTAVIPNAMVSIAPVSPAASNATKSVVLKTGHSGTVSPKLKTGAYMVSVSAPGFWTVHKRVSVLEKTSLVVELEVGIVNGPVAVTPTYNPALSPESVPLHQLIPDAP